MGVGLQVVKYFTLESSVSESLFIGESLLPLNPDKSDDVMNLFYLDGSARLAKFDSYLSAPLLLKFNGQLR